LIRRVLICRILLVENLCLVLLATELSKHPGSDSIDIGYLCITLDSIGVR
jgi:hypothetical protein